MLELLLQVLVTFSLITGIIIGELLAQKAFGINNKWYLNFIDILIFVILTILLLNLIYLKEINYTLILLINFLVGCGSILITKGVTTGFGFLSSKLYGKVQKKEVITIDVIIAGLFRNLINKGLLNDEVKTILLNSGFNKKKVENFAKKSFYEQLEQKGTKRNK